jgi:hypothetical protein
LGTVELKKMNGSKKRKIYNKEEKEVRIRKRRKKNNSKEDDERNIQQEKNVESENEDSDKEINKIELLIKELNTPITLQIIITDVETDKTRENNDIKRLAIQYRKLEEGNRKLLKD